MIKIKKISLFFLIPYIVKIFSLFGSFYVGKKLIKVHESKLHSIAKLLFQSAEESFAGARAIINAGNPKYSVMYRRWFVMKKKPPGVRT